MVSTPKVIKKIADKKKDGTVPLKLYISLGKPVYIDLSVSVDPEHFDEGKQKVVKRKDAKELNMIIGKKLNQANDILIDYRLMQSRLTPEIFRDLMNNPEARKDFIQFFERTLYERYKQRDIAFGTFKKHRVVLNKLKQYTSELPFAGLTNEFLEKFDRWHLKHLQRESHKRGKPLVNNGKNIRAHTLKEIRTYLNIAIKKKGIRAPYPFTGHRIEYVESSRVYLSREELQRLIDMYYSADLKPLLKRVLQYFLFACFTSLRISDIQRFKPEWIQDGELVYYPHKTRNQYKEVRIPLTEPALRFLKDEHGDYFKPISDQKTNKALKEIAEIAGIEKHLTFHVARHTFGTLALESGVSVETLQEVLGHSDIKTTQIYAKITSRKKHEELKGMNNLGQ